MDKLELQKVANEVRKDIVTAVHAAKAGHPGGSLSAADVFTYLYFEEMNIDPKDPKKADRDRFVLSKGHTAPGLYSVLAERGYFPKEDLKTLRHLGSYLQGHPDMKHIPGVDMSSGSLGQGISAAAGMALSAKLSNDDYRVYTLLGDGEIEEGQVWEAAMFAGFRKLDNLVVIVDNNGLQIDGDIADVCSPYPIDKKFEAFNFHVINVADGNDMEQLRKAFAEAKKAFPPHYELKAPRYRHAGLAAPDKALQTRSCASSSASAYGSYGICDCAAPAPRWCRRTFSRAPDKKIHPRWPLVRSIPPEGESRSHKDGILRPYGGFHQRLETVPRESARRSAVRSSAAPGFLARSEKLECRYARKTEGTPSCNGFHFLSFLQR